MLIRRMPPASDSDVIETSMTLTFPTRPCHCKLSRGWTLYEVNLAVDPDGKEVALQCIWECEACGHMRPTGALAKDGAS